MHLAAQHQIKQRSLVIAVYNADETHISMCVWRRYPDPTLTWTASYV